MDLNLNSMNRFNNEYQKKLDQFHVASQQNFLHCGLKGLEKESLRISETGNIAQTLHPDALGSSLTHPYITTDYSEALIELITPPFADIVDTLGYMSEIHQFVYQHLTNEQLLVTSMPCGIDGDHSIPIAQYGTSNIGRMKHIYRHGLWHRYGRTMQAIAGIHFNYSVPEKLWLLLHGELKPHVDLNQFIADAYFGLIRNFQRMGWLILYLFGASPAICRSFFNGRADLIKQFEEFDADTLCHPYATSLRMSDIGYKSKNQANLLIDYNSIDGYVASLSAAINTPYPEYEKIGVVVGGDYRQLNSNILQIENEFYSTIRPKQIANSGEKPTLALKRRGIRYVEIRSLDLNPFKPIGIGEDEARFVETLLLTCLLLDSPAHHAEEHLTNNANQLAVANFGRKPGVLLQRDQQSIALQDWAFDVFAAMRPVAEALDQGDSAKPYDATLSRLSLLLEDPALTPSAQMLEQMSSLRQSYSQYALQISNEHARYFKNMPMDQTVRQRFDDMAVLSHDKQHQLEKQSSMVFDEFLQQYFSQK